MVRMNLDRSPSRMVMVDGCDSSWAKTPRGRRGLDASSLNASTKWSTVTCDFMVEI